MPPNQINTLRFNQDYTCLSVATRMGLRIFSCETGQCCYEETVGSVRIVEMLFCTSLLSVVGNGDSPTLSPRKLCVLNTASESPIADLSFPSAVLAVRLSRDRLVAVLERRIHVYELATLKPLETIETVLNASGLCALAPSGRPLLALPASLTEGRVTVRNAGACHTLCEIDAHCAPLAAIAFSHDGGMLASSSTKGTVVRVHSLPLGTILYSFRRGSRPAHVGSLAFAATTPPVLVASSSSGSVHLFRLAACVRNATKCASAAAALLTQVIPRSFAEPVREVAETQRAAAVIHLPPAAVAAAAAGGAGIVCGVVPLPMSDPQAPEQGGGEGGARVFVASDAGFQEWRVTGLHLPGECAISLEREGTLLPRPGADGGPELATARWLLDPQPPAAGDERSAAADLSQSVSMSMLHSILLRPHPGAGRGGPAASAWGGGAGGDEAAGAGEDEPAGLILDPVADHTSHYGNEKIVTTLTFGVPHAEPFGVPHAEPDSAGGVPVSQALNGKSEAAHDGAVDGNGVAANEGPEARADHATAADGAAAAAAAAKASADAAADAAAAKESADAATAAAADAAAAAAADSAAAAAAAAAVADAAAAAEAQEAVIALVAAAAAADAAAAAAATVAAAAASTAAAAAASDAAEAAAASAAETTEETDDAPDAVAPAPVVAAAAATAEGGDGNCSGGPAAAPHQQGEPEEAETQHDAKSRSKAKGKKAKKKAGQAAAAADDESAEAEVDDGPNSL